MKQSKEKFEKVWLCYTSKEDIKEYNTNCPKIFDHPYKTLINGSSGLGKTNSLLTPINHKPITTDGVYLYNKDPYKPK